MSEATGPEHRVLVVAPTGRDADLVQSVLAKAGVECLAFRDTSELVVELARGASALLVAEEALADDRFAVLARALRNAPPWSDLPVLILARPGADSAAVAMAMEVLGNVTIIERPTRFAALISAVRSALRARTRQYQIREHLEQRARVEAELREAARRKDEFLAVLAHELRNPLAPIRNSLHILRMTSHGDPTVANVGEIMERQVNHLVRLVDDLVEVARITRGKIELRRSFVDLARVIRQAVETSQPFVDAAGHELTVALPPQPLAVDADPVRLTQVFSNLLNNAAKFTEPGGSIRLSARAQDGWAQVSVRDTGRGIPADMLDRVFDLFTQVDAAGPRMRSGLGIGLTLVKTLVEMHGGSVTAHSEGPGAGSEFVVRLPLAASATPSPSEPEAPERASFGALRVLVVDDNHDAADTLGALLGLLGADVEVVHGGEEALRAVDEKPPSLVLLDLGMPGMDGYEVARRIRSQPDMRGVTLAALTGWGQAEDRARSRAAGFDVHLVKPPDLAALEALVSTLVRG